MAHAPDRHYYDEQHNNDTMSLELGTRSALLLALCDGPGHAPGFIARLGSLQVRLHQGAVSRALQSLEAGGLVRSWSVARRRRGRPRRLYELTPTGIEVATRQWDAMRALVTARREPLRGGVAKARRLTEALERSKLAMARVAVRLGEALPERHALIGGLVVGVHGCVRPTTGVDFVVSGEPARLRARLKGAGIQATLRRGVSFEGHSPWVLYGEIQGIPFDLFAPNVPIDWDRRELVRLGKSEVHVVDLRGLLRLKLRAGGHTDLVDVAALLHRQPEQKAWATEVADCYGLRERLELLLRPLRASVPTARPCFPRGRPPRRTSRWRPP